MRLVTKRLSVKIKYLLITGILISIYVIVSYNLFEDMFTKNSKDDIGMRNISYLKLPNVIVHLDFKGSPPKLSYLKTLLPKFQELGVTGLLMEYEDMFPYNGRIANISAKNCYEKSKLKEFLKLAIQLGFDIIPLVQTFGHMEHVLKLAEFQHLREIPSYPDSICPSNSESQMIIKRMLEQIIKFHEKIFPVKYLHIGCDEVFNINKCQRCLKRNLPNTEIYLSQVQVVADLVKTISPNTTVLIWDDMFRGIPINTWERIKHQVEPVYWDYGPSVRVSHVNMRKYYKKFKNIWIASSFKGADGRAATYPNIKKRLWNNFSWMNKIRDYKFGGENEAYSFQGIILTGWSRYNHMEPPCELLPISLPSLFLNLLLIKKFKEGLENVENVDVIDFYMTYLRDEFSGHLHCSHLINIDYFDTNQCYFDGNELYQLFVSWDLINTNILNSINEIDSDLFAVDFYSQSHNINMIKLRQNKEWLYQSLNEVVYYKNKIMTILNPYYDDYFIEEYSNFKFYKTKALLHDVLRALNNVSKVKTWTRRPYKYN
ncbi:hexosaminidase D-like [Vanessa cardui]|uniref:hexosaminidase D-like n=1 Tax=Vanessa cardui TaxID=171605 RepID=UPI001F136508|nr:hexosaminidase D-like [Vanessa cardui]